jgi:hypothetical protein
MGNNTQVIAVLVLGLIGISVWLMLANTTAAQNSGCCACCVFILGYIGFALWLQAFPGMDEDPANLPVKYHKMTVVQLKELLRERDLATNGLKDDLIYRLKTNEWRNKDLD